MFFPQEIFMWATLLLNKKQGRMKILMKCRWVRSTLRSRVTAFTLKVQVQEPGDLDDDLLKQPW